MSRVLTVGDKQSCQQPHHRNVIFFHFHMSLPSCSYVVSFILVRGDAMSLNGVALVIQKIIFELVRIFSDWLSR